MGVGVGVGVKWGEDCVEGVEDGEGGGGGRGGGRVWRELGLGEGLVSGRKCRGRGMRGRLRLG